MADPSTDELEGALLTLFSEVVPARALPDVETLFFQAGFTSIELMRITQALQKRLGGASLSIVLLFEHNSIAKVATKLSADRPDSLAKLRA